MWKSNFTAPAIDATCPVTSTPRREASSMACPWGAPTHWLIYTQATRCARPNCSSAGRPLRTSTLTEMTILLPEILKIAFARDGREAFMIPAWIAQRDLDQDGAVSYDDFLHSVASSFAVPAKAKAKNKDEG